MIKKVVLLILVFFFLLTNQTLAHTGLEDSTPKNGEVIKEPLQQQITLSFATKIEQTSTIEVLNSNGQAIDLGNFVIEDSEIWATFLQPLESDTYNVNWSIIGADGHPIEGTLSFTVDVSEEASALDEDQTEQQTEDKQLEDNLEDSAKSTIQEEKQIKMPSYVIPSIIIFLFVVVTVVLFGS